MDPLQFPARSDDLLKPLENFRGRSQRLKVHPLESAALWTVGIHLSFLPWALGAMWPWAQLTSLCLAVAAMGFALWPRNYGPDHTGGARFRLIMWPKLASFPVFWIGFAILAYVVAQGLNPAWSFRTDGRLFWMQAVPAVGWLPPGYEAPFAKWNPWRLLVIYSSVWLTVCTIWVAVTRRRSLQFLFLAIAINGLLVATFGVAQRLMGNGRIYWFIDSPNLQFFGPFVYKNHAGAYLNLALAVTCGLAGWFYLRGQRRMEKSNPSGVLAFCATCISVAILTSYARGATLIMLVFLALCIGVFVWHQITSAHSNRKPVVAVALLLIFGVFLKSGLDALRTGEAWNHIRQGITRQDQSLDLREKVASAAAEMLRDRWTTGTGAGSFRFLFPIYQHRHPELNGPEGKGIYWEHAHNDLLQFPIELGFAGTALILSAAGYFLVALCRCHFWENPLSLCILLKLTLLVVYAWWDFPFQNPAILITAAALLPAVTVWARLEEQGARS